MTFEKCLQRLVYNGENQNKRKSQELDDLTPDDSEQMKDEFEKLKSIVVSENEMPNIKQKLIATTQYRMELMADKKLDVREAFPYFFIGNTSWEFVSCIFFI